MAIVTQNPDEIKTSETVSSFMRRFGIAKLIARCGAYKEKGISVLELFLAVFQNVFSDRSMYRQMKTGRWDHDFSKNTVYRFRDCAKIHWERLTALLSAAVANVLRPLTSEKRKETFIVDDTLYARTGYRRTELCTKVYDHSDGRYRKGFRLLTLGWSDGNTFLPVTHRLLSSANEKNVLGAVEKKDFRTLAGRRRKQAQKKGTEVMIDLLKSALKAFDGTLIVVSHDRDFLDGLVDKLYEFRDGRVKEHLGGVSEFLERRRIENLSELERRFGGTPSGPSAPPAEPKKAEAREDFAARRSLSKEARKVRNRISFLETEIGKDEKRMKAIETVLAAPGPSDDIMELTREYLELKRDLDAKTDEWASLMDDM